MSSVKLVGKVIRSITAFKRTTGSKPVGELNADMSSSSGGRPDKVGTGDHASRGVKDAIKLTVTVNAVVISMLAIAILWWILAAKPYLNFPRPPGGDFYNALTYAEFFRKYITLPTTGWMHLWHQGTPVISGYPWFFFYVAHPIYIISGVVSSVLAYLGSPSVLQLFDAAQAIQIVSVVSLLFYLLASFILFWEVGKNVLLAFTLTLVLMITRATYYPLFSGGFVVAASVQWLLPVVLIFLYRFLKRHSLRYLVLAGVAAGLSILIHSPISALLIVLPASVFLLFAAKRWSTSFKYIGIFYTFAFLVGSMGIYTVLVQLLFGQGHDPCDHLFCRGRYPQDLYEFHVLGVIIPAILIVSTFVVKIFKRKIKLVKILPFFAIFLIPTLYSVATYFRLVDLMAVFPRRTFWAVSFFALLLGVASFGEIRKVLPKASHLVPFVLVFLLGFFYIRNPQTYYPAPKTLINAQSYPDEAHEFVIPKYRTYDFSERIPEWFPTSEVNYRFDTFNQDMNLWWNVASTMPVTRGFSNFPLGSHRDWLFFLQSSVGQEQPEEVKKDDIRNRAYFLLDAFAIGFHEDSGGTRLHEDLISDSELVERYTARHGDYYQFSKDIVTPIVSPTNSPAVLFIGDDAGYANFVRSLALSNLNSKVLIPVHGPKNFDEIKEEELDNFKAVILDRFEGKKWKRLEQFVEKGGLLFVESSSEYEKDSSNLANIFPVSAVKVNKTRQPEWDIGEGELKSYKIDASNFSELEFEGGSWTIQQADSDEVRNWANPILTQGGKVLMAGGKYGEGNVIWSGWNFIFHIVNKDNFEEAKLFGELIKENLEATGREEVAFEVARARPESIKVTGKNISGVYFKENFHSGWRAKVNGKPAKIYPAGLDFMYIPVSGDSQQSDISINFRGTFVAWLLFITTILAILLSLVYIIFPRPWHRLFFKVSSKLEILTKITTKNIIHYWDSDEF